MMIWTRSSLRLIDWLIDWQMLFGRCWAGLVSKSSSQVEEAREHTSRSWSSWSRLPSTDMQRWPDPGRRASSTGGAWPRAQRRQGREGEAAATCLSDADQRPGTLSVARHDPPGRRDACPTRPYFRSRDVGSRDDVIEWLRERRLGSERRRYSCQPKRGITCSSWRFRIVVFVASLRQSGRTASQQLCSQRRAHFRWRQRKPCRWRHQYKCY